MAFGPSVRIVNETGKPRDTYVIEPVSGNRIPNIRKVTWEVGVDHLAVATIELFATLDVMADGTFVVTPQLERIRTARDIYGPQE